MGRHLLLDPIDDLFAQLWIGHFVQAVQHDQALAGAEFLLEPTWRCLLFQLGQALVDRLSQREVFVLGDRAGVLPEEEQDRQQAGRFDLVPHFLAQRQSQRHVLQERRFARTWRTQNR